MRVNVVGNDGNVLKGEFEELSRNKSIVTVKNVRTGKVIGVHNTRVYRAGGTKITMVIKSEDDMATAKKKVVGVPYDWKKVSGERWTKRIKFDHADIVAEAHVVIDRDARTYRTINTYNGSLGSSGKGGNSFSYDDYDKLAYKLKKKGYVKRPTGARPEAKAIPPSAQV